MLILFYFKSKLSYSYQPFEWGSYVAVLHFYIFGKIVSKKLWKMRESIGTFDEPSGNEEKLRKFYRLHLVGRFLYGGQTLGVIMLLYLHAFGL